LLDIVASQLKRKGVNPDKASMPKHIAMTVGGLGRWSNRTGEEHKEAYKQAFSKVEDMIRFQTCFDIPIITLYMINSRINQSADFSVMVDAMAEFFKSLSQNNDVLKNKVKISILGKWYDLPGRVVENIKQVIDETKDYDNFFMNLCINYDGREEIVDACRIILRKALLEKMDPDAVDADMIKDNIYSSYFLPPDLIVKTGTGKRLHGFLLWDSTQAMIYFSDVLWPEFKEKDFINAIKYYQENKNRV
jgi:undecaprenyl diphosphate synthase